ncbi:DNA-3-methyladenine glycosylase 2 family protein [Mucilaginibacter mali]|uniref:DNA-3-methyladenine glycosylase II n=1 Tax=Mucilaginibacter mali TaxID=2740462 RepID=A0A7D4UH03_9SPHI|nr:DNA-3-methyladenine glycosylase 2 family protein [Mucilaginibacter mali]QKJ32496.1 DNA-3-methyladenine glycosylase 2 family protein [Mucilaginibacter mali]
MDEILLTNPINPTELLWFLSRGFDDPVYRVGTDCVYRAFKVDDEKLLVKIIPNTSSVKIEWLYGNRTEETAAFVKNFISEWFDLNTDVTPFYDLLKADDKLSYMADDFTNLKLVGMPDLFEALAWAIMSQQINLTFAYKLKRRLIEKYGDFIEHEDTRHYIFPSPAAIANANDEELRAMQLSGSKINYLKSIAAAFAGRKIDKTILMALPDTSTRRELLTAQKGIGIWTANYVLMKYLRDQSAIPYGDAGLLNALLKHEIIADKKDLSGMPALFKKFKGWEAYLVFYLWRSLALMPGVS